MGRRKERKVAAAGRRVKLDLFAQPYGDLGGSSVQDEVGGEEESKIHAESPSSSGQQPENPLMLLGQYSDDEADEGSSERIKCAASEDFPHDLEDQEKQATEEDNNVNGESGSTVPEVEEQPIHSGSDIPGPLDRSAEDSNKENNTSDTVDLNGQLSVMEQITAPATSDAQDRDASSGWKMVLHEESNQYYYWNIVTGETSWEVPKILGHATEPMFEEKITAEIKCMGNVTSGYLESSANLDIDVKHTGNCYSNINEDKQPIEDALHANKGDYSENRSDTINGSEQIDSQRNETSPGGSLSSGQSGALAGHFNGSGEDSTKYRDADYVHEVDETGADFSSDLVKHCEHLLEHLKTMKGSEHYVQMHDKISKYALELEIRLTDIKSLACNGLSLLPFWVHSERKIKFLESEINQICGQISSGQHSYVEAGQRVGNHVPNSSVERPTHSASSDASEEGGAAGVSAHEDLTPQTVLHPAEEVDMDVDMEVEDTEPSRSLTGGDALHTPIHAALDIASLSVPQTKLESPVSEPTPGAPPPPDENWIPPPPPDNELFPPPPPDEPLDHTHVLSSDMESIQPFTYNLAYPGSEFGYYGPTNPDVTSLYATSDGQIAVTPQPLYYQIPSTYASGPLPINRVDPCAYYGHQDGTLQPVSVASGAESSGSPAVNENVAADAIPSFDVNGGLRSHSLAKTEVDVPLNMETEKISADISATQPSFQSTGCVSTTEGVAIASASAVTSVVATASTAHSKGQSKLFSVLRNKKRTAGVVSTLRSNKKVSNLVDKWKAAKEELHAEEEEPERALEKLEKKRQREIEEWRAQQISSGEAKDNANFQPLGGDWRERVKQKRAEKMREAEKQPSEENEQPDLNILSTGLPSGWQAYWDDSSKQVYYGNAATSETTWNRPGFN